MFANNWICESQKFKIPLDNDSNNDIMLRLVLVRFKVGVIIVQVREACKHICLKQMFFSKCQGVLASWKCEGQVVVVTIYFSGANYSSLGI